MRDRADRNLEFTDIHDNKLFSLKNKHFTIHKSFKAEGPDGKDLFEVKGHFALLSSKSTCVFNNVADGREVELEIKGGMCTFLDFTVWEQILYEIHNETSRLIKT